MLPRLAALVAQDRERSPLSSIPAPLESLSLKIDDLYQPLVLPKRRTFGGVCRILCSACGGSVTRRIQLTPQTRIDANWTQLNIPAIITDSVSRVSLDTSVCPHETPIPHIPSTALSRSIVVPPSDGSTGKSDTKISTSGLQTIRDLWFRVRPRSTVVNGLAASSTIVALTSYTR